MSVCDLVSFSFRFCFQLLLVVPFRHPIAESSGLEHDWDELIEQATKDKLIFFEMHRFHNPHDCFVHEHAFGNVCVLFPELFSRSKHRVLRDIGLDIIRVNIADMDSVGLDFSTKSFPKAAQAKLRRTVHGTDGHAEQAGERENIDNLTSLSLNHSVKHALDHGNMRRAIYVHHAFDHFQLEVLKTVAHRRAPIVNYYVDLLFGKERLCSLKHFSWLAQIKRENADLTAF